MSFDTSFPEKQNNKAIINYIESILKPLGFKCSKIKSNVFENQHSLIAVFNPSNKLGGILFSGHLDTVKPDKNWKTNPYKLKVTDDKAYGLGTVDMKGFSACLFSVLSSVNLNKFSKPIYLCFTYDEETTVKSIEEVTQFLVENKINPDIAIVGEPTKLNIVNSGKGYFGYTTTFIGKECHSRKPQNGINSIYMASKFSIELEKLNTFCSKSNVNVGVIKGGTIPNGVPAECFIEWEIRPDNSNDLEKIKKKVSEKINEILKFYNGSTIKTKSRESLLPFNYIEDNKAKDLCLKISPESKISKGVGAGEAGYYQKSGIDTVYCGPGDNKMAHKKNEYIELNELKKYKAFLLKLLV